MNPGGALGAAGARGGLMYAGVNGNPTEQGNQPAAKFSPRVGFVYSMNPKTVVRGGYGIYQAPWNYQARRLGQLRQGRLQPEHVHGAGPVQADRDA